MDRVRSGAGRGAREGGTIDGRWKREREVVDRLDPDHVEGWHQDGEAGDLALREEVADRAIIMRRRGQIGIFPSRWYVALGVPRARQRMECGTADGQRPVEEEQ